MTLDRPVVAAGVLVWLGATLLLSSWPRVSRVSLQERLPPFHSALGGRPVRRAQSAAELLVPLTEAVGARLAALFGVAEPVERRLRRIHSATSPAAFRLRQMAGCLGALLAAAAVAGLADGGVAIDLLLVAGGPLLAFLVVEQGLARRSERWQASVAAELPLVAEQLAMLLNAGYSLGAALSRLAARGSGCVVRDLEQVVNRVQQGLSDAAALREWSEVAGVAQVDRLVSVLTLHGEASELGRLVSEEARQCRRDLHRRTVELMDKRGQQVWVPVTVATLVPGAILIAVPFVSALRVFANA
jgi:tight adherence protein C